jgi:excalibur calcium-binding domain-containing protein
VSLLLIYMKSTLRAIAFVLLASVSLLSLVVAAPVYKCIINGTVTYQTVPRPSGEVRRVPTVEQLNVERQKKLQQPVDGRSPNAAAPSGAPALGETKRRTSAVTQTAPPATTPKCDGRIYCSQMTSCAEAKYFLANCPGVKMDGDRNGIPCEQQWCNK